MHGRVRADRDDQRRHQDERQRRRGICPAIDARLAPNVIPVLLAGGTGLGTDARAHDRLDDPALAELVAADLVDDRPARHHDDAVTEPGELERIARLDDDRNALLRLRAQRVVDVEPRGDVDSLRRLLGEDDLDVPAEERARQRDLLLVAAGKGLHRLLDRRHPDAEAAGELVDRAALTPSVQQAEASQPPQNLDRRVGAHAQDREERLPRLDRR